MSQIQNYGQRADYVEGKPGQVLSMTMVDVVAAKYTDNAGRVNVLLGLFFGKDAEGEPQMIIMNPDEIAQNFKVPSPQIRTGLLRLYKQQRTTSPTELPEGRVGSLEIEEVA